MSYKHAPKGWANNILCKNCLDKFLLEHGDEVIKLDEAHNAVELLRKQASKATEIQRSERADKKAAQTTMTEEHFAMIGFMLAGLYCLSQGSMVIGVIIHNNFFCNDRTRSKIESPSQHLKCPVEKALACETIAHFSLDQFIKYTWQRNSLIDIVEFMFDENGNIVGRAVHPIEGMTFKEFFYCAYTLAASTDRLEYLIQEQDLH